MKVGEVAKRAGLSVRTLHHYEEIGLLVPSERTERGHRRYSQGDLARLQQIVSLRQLGLSLAEIGDCLQRRDFSPLEVIERHLAHLAAQRALIDILMARLANVAQVLRRGDEVSPAQFLQTVEGMTMYEKYYTPDQLTRLQTIYEQIGDEGIQKAEADWQQLFADIREAVAEGVDPSSERAQALAARWNALIDAFTGGADDMKASLYYLYMGEPEVAQRYGPSPEVAEFMGKAMC